MQLGEPSSATTLALAGGRSARFVGRLDAGAAGGVSVRIGRLDGRELGEAARDRVAHPAAGRVEVLSARCRRYGVTHWP